MQKTTMESAYLGQSTQCEPELPRNSHQDHSMLDDRQSQANYQHDSNANPMDQAKDLNERDKPVFDMGSRWCPQEVEIFFECKSLLSF